MEGAQPGVPAPTGQGWGALLRAPSQWPGRQPGAQRGGFRGTEAAGVGREGRARREELRTLRAFCQLPRETPAPAPARKAQSPGPGRFGDQGLGRVRADPGADASSPSCGVRPFTPQIKRSQASEEHAAFPRGGGTAWALRNRPSSGLSPSLTPRSPRTRGSAPQHETSQKVPEPGPGP